MSAGGLQILNHAQNWMTMCVGHNLDESRLDFKNILRECTCCQADVSKECSVE